MAASAIEELRRIRVAQIDDPERVIELGGTVLKRGGLRAAGDEYWTILDQVAVAALITANDTLAKGCIDQISAKFPVSPRTHALCGMLFEAGERLTEAAEYYDYILKKDSMNSTVWKRRIALLRSTNKPAEAIAQLTSLLDTFPNDTEGWAELADLYLSQSMLAQAAFCLEELILLQPNLHYVHAQYAEILWLLGKEASALKYWCRSVELCSDFLRGWFGATKKILAKPGNSKSRVQNEDAEFPSTETIVKLDKLATERLSKLSIKASSAERTAATALIGDAATSTTS